MGSVAVKKVVDGRRNSGRKLPKSVVRERHRAILGYLSKNPGSSRRAIADGVGLTEKQVDHTLHTVRRWNAERRSGDVFRFRQYGRCAGQPKRCGPCARCLGPCPVCHRPVREDDSRHKVPVERNGDGPSEGWAHFGCGE